MGSRSTLPATRRAVLGGGAALGLAASMPSGAAASMNEPDIAALSPEDRLTLYMKLRGDSSGLLVGFLYQADLFALLPGEILPVLVRNIGLSWTRFEKVGESQWEQRINEAGYYLGEDKRTIIDTLSDPLIGDDVPIKHYKTEAVFKVSPDIIEMSTPRADVEVDFPMPAPFMNGPFLWAHEDAQGAYGTNENGRVEDVGNLRRRVTQLVSFMADAEGAFRPHVTALRSITSSILVTDTRPLLPSLETPVPLVWRFYGHKIFSSAELPQWFADRAESDHPGFISAPSA